MEVDGKEGEEVVERDCVCDCWPRAGMDAESKLPAKAIASNAFVPVGLFVEIVKT
ncbi:hypothetical protein KA344_16320 [bacterium]|nr:hypothetical protein [bacterium]